MLLVGRLSNTNTWLAANVAGALPVLDTWIVQVQLLPRVVAWLTLSLFVAIRSGAVTVTESLKVLLLSLPSVMTLLGSTEAEPPLRGLAKVPVALGVAVNTRSKLPPPARTTLPPLAVAVRLLLAMAAL